MTITLSEIQRLHDECVREADEKCSGLALYFLDVTMRNLCIHEDASMVYSKRAKDHASVNAFSGPWAELDEAVKAWRAMSREERLEALREEMGSMALGMGHWGDEFTPEWWSDFDQLARVRAQVKMMEGK